MARMAGGAADVAHAIASQASLCLCGDRDARATAISDRGGLKISRMVCDGDPFLRWKRIETRQATRD